MLLKSDGAVSIEQFFESLSAKLSTLVSLSPHLEVLHLDCVDIRSVGLNTGLLLVIFIWLLEDLSGKALLHGVHDEDDGCSDGDSCSNDVSGAVDDHDCSLVEGLLAGLPLLVFPVEDDNQPVGDKEPHEDPKKSELLQFLQHLVA